MISIIPARKGSKGVLNKNFRMIPDLNINLVDLTILQAVLSKKFEKIIVTCDCDYIPNESIRKLIDIPFVIIRRPSSFALDKSPVEDAIMHLYKENQIKHFDMICLLQPTSPMRTPESIALVVDYFKISGTPVTGVTNVGDKHPSRMYQIEDLNLIRIWEETATRRQDLSNIYLRNGLFYLFNFKDILKNKRITDLDFRAFNVPSQQSLNIDEVDDWYMLEIKASKGELDWVKKYIF